MKFGIAYLPSVGRLNDFASAFHRLMKNVQLGQVSRIEMMFDPFTGKTAESLRSFIFISDYKKIITYWWLTVTVTGLI